MTRAPGNLAALAETAARNGGWWNEPALVVDGMTFSHGDVHMGAARGASVLAAMGVGPPDTVLLALADGVQFAWAFLGSVRLGALAVPVNPLLPPDDHRYLVQDCGAEVVVCEDALEPRFDQPTRVLGSSALVGSVADYDPHPALAVDADDRAYAQYTSGTTGIPRAAVHRHGDPAIYTRAVAEQALAMTSEDVVLSVSKMYFAYGLGNSLFFPLLTGARAVLLSGRPHPCEIAELAARHSATMLFAVPTFYANLLREEATESFASLRVAVSAGERLTPQLAEAAADRLGCTLIDSLGSTEVGQGFAGGSLGCTRPGTVGPALPPYEIAVRDDLGHDLAPGAAGMLWVRGPTVLVEYLGRPKATAEAFDGDWLRTGDLASLDADGFLSHHGRADDMEMVGGISVAPQEIEEVLSHHPAVSEVAVVAVDDGNGASALQAFVVAATDYPDDDRITAELKELARRHLVAYKVPRSVQFVDALPRTATGKLKRFILRTAKDRSPGLGVG